VKAPLAGTFPSGAALRSRRAANLPRKPAWCAGAPPGPCRISNRIPRRGPGSQTSTLSEREAGDADEDQEHAAHCSGCSGSPSMKHSAHDRNQDVGALNEGIRRIA